MSSKILIAGVGAAAVPAAGAYVGGVMYTKSAGVEHSQKVVSNAQAFLDEIEVPLELTEKGEPETSFGASVHSYELSAPDEQTIPFKIRHSYGFGSVDSKLVVDDETYKKLQLEGPELELAKNLVDGFSNTYSVFSDTSTSKLKLKEGSLSGSDVTLSWKSGGLTTRISGLSRETSAGALKLDLPEVELKPTSAEASGQGLKVSGLLLDIDNSETLVSDIDFRLGSLAYAADGKSVAVEKASLNAASKPSSTGKNRFDIELGLDLGSYAYKTEQKNLEIRSGVLKLELDNVNYNDIAMRCGKNGAMPSGFSLDFTRCMQSLKKKEQETILASMVQADTRVGLEVKFSINGANVDLKSALSFKEGVDLSNTLSLLTSAQLNADYRIDAKLFENKDLDLDGIGVIIKQYAKDPTAATLEYHIEFSNGSFLVNGKKLN